MITTISIDRFVYDSTTDTHYLTTKTDSVNKSETVNIVCVHNNTVFIAAEIPYYDL